MLMQWQKILLLIDKCPNHTPITLSNVAVKVLPENMTLIILPLDQGSIALLKRAYMRYMMRAIMVAMKASQNITDFAKKVSKFNVVLNTNVALDTVPEAALH